MSTFKIKDIFKITDRGHVLSGIASDKEVILTDDKVLVTDGYEGVVLRISGVSIEKDEGHFGLLISFADFDKLKGIDLTKSELRIIKTKERQRLVTGSIEWTGDLSDDCTAQWAGLMLRAEWMDENYWWWAVYDMENDEVTIDSSNHYSSRFIGGVSARQKAEEIAKSYLSI